MNNELKEMLEQMESIAITGKSINGVKVDGYGLQQNELKMFLDYITNLQQENKSLTEQLEYLRSGEYLNQVKWERDLNENLNQTMSIELIDYKSRCEKAIEYIKENNCPDPYCLTDDLLNILQNGSDKE